MNKIKATIYFKGEVLGDIIRKEIFLIDHKLTNYAQYKNIPEVTFILKGKRNPIKLLKGYKPFYLILEGWNTPHYNNGYNTTIKEGVTIEESKYLCFDERYITDFNKFINPQLEKHNIIVDYRYNKEC